MKNKNPHLHSKCRLSAQNKILGTHAALETPDNNTDKTTHYELASCIICSCML